jgi:hypothetical protein
MLSDDSAGDVDRDLGNITVSISELEVWFG